MNKKGSHVGVIASFSIFLLFLVAIYLIFEPAFQSQKNEEATLDYLEKELIEEISTNLTQIMISPTPGVCSLLDTSALGVGGLEFVARNSADVIGTEISGNNLLVESSGEELLWIYFSEEDFDETLGDFDSCVAPEIKNIKVKNLAFETKIKNVINNYELVESGFDLPLAKESGFVFRFENGTELRTRKNEVFENMNVREKEIEYVDEKAVIHSGKIFIEVWG